MQHQITTQVEISAPAERVWDVLIQWDAYPHWNPFIRHIAGVPEEGAHPKFHLQLVHGRGVRLRGTVQTVRAQEQLRWTAYLWLPGLLEADQQFVLEPRGDGTTVLVQRIAFRGLLIPMTWRSLKRTARRGAMLMNAALKGNVENFGKAGEG